MSSHQDISDPKNQSAVLWDNAGRIFLYLFAVSLIVLLLLRQFPALDIAASLSFFTVRSCEYYLGNNGLNTLAVRCGGFDWIRNETLQTVRMIGLALPRYLAVGILLWLAYQLSFNRFKSPRSLAVPFLGFFSLIVGPGIITNLILKSYWGRPRPFQTEDFGSFHPYVSPGTISEYCAENCSFVSGEASGAFWLLWIVPVVPHKWRWVTLIVVLAVALPIAILRIAFGRHYASDVIMAGMISMTSIAFVAWVLQTAPILNLIERLCATSNRLLHKWRGITQ